MGWQEMIDKGGPVVLILLGYSLTAITVVVERLLHFALLPRPAKDFEQQLRANPGSGRVERGGGDGGGPEVVVVRGMLAAATAGVKDLAQVASRLGSDELQRMERGFRTLGMLGNTAPLWGLFGTITGLIKAFKVIEQAGGRVDAQALAGGIWEAMITTGVGLAVAIPILLLLHMLEGLADRRARSMRYYASIVLERWQIATAAEEKVDNELVAHRPGVLTSAI
ncbi:MAG: MotA/TolQ/ExbB proton channel family protein [Thermodesulfobacteriota bacterium]